MSKINLIFAASLDGFIGKDGTIPWSVPEDLARFKELTQGHHLVMGRKTWESLPVRPLKGRNSIVLSHTGNFKDCHKASDSNHPLPVFFNECILDTSDKIYWVIGGEKVLSAALPYATEIYETLVDTVAAGDAKSPSVAEIMKHDFVVASESGQWHTSTTGTRYWFTKWVKYHAL